MPQGFTLPHFPLGITMSHRPRASWYGWATTKGRLTKTAMREAGITETDLERDRRHPLPERTASIYSAYCKTQYAKLRRVGVNREEAWRLSRGGSPKRVVESTREMRGYVEEMVLKHGTPPSKRAWDATRKRIQKHIRSKDYTLSDWALFSDWYISHKKGSYKYGVAAVRRMREPTPHEAVPPPPPGIAEPTPPRGVERPRDVMRRMGISSVKQLEAVIRGAKKVLRGIQAEKQARDRAGRFVKHERKSAAQKPVRRVREARSSKGRKPSTAHRKPRQKR